MRHQFGDAGKQCLLLCLGSSGLGGDLDVGDVVAVRHVQVAGWKDQTRLVQTMNHLKTIQLGDAEGLHQTLVHRVGHRMLDLRRVFVVQMDGDEGHGGSR